MVTGKKRGRPKKESKPLAVPDDFFSRPASLIRADSVDQLQQLRTELEFRGLNHGFYYYETEDDEQPDGTVIFRYRLDQQGNRIPRTPDGVRTFLAIQDHRLRVQMASVTVHKQQRELLALDADSEVSVKAKIKAEMDHLMKAIFDELDARFPEDRQKALAWYNSVQRRYFRATGKMPPGEKL